MRNWLIVLALCTGGCGGLASRQARVRVWDSGVSYARFGTQEMVEMDRIGTCRYLIESIGQPQYREPHAGPIRVTVPQGDPVVLPVDFVGQYRDAVRRQEPLWKGGEPIVIEAPRRHAPAFRVELPA